MYDNQFKKNKKSFIWYRSYLMLIFFTEVYNLLSNISQCLIYVQILKYNTKLNLQSRNIIGFHCSTQNGA